MADSASIAPQARSTGDLKARILVEATRLFAERGYGEASMRAVAEAAGCTKAALYYHFDSKDALFASCLEALKLRWGALLESKSAGGTVKARLTSAIEAFFGDLRQAPEGMRLLYRAVLSPEDGQPSLNPATFRDAPTRLTVALIGEGIAAGEVRPDVRLDDVVSALMGMVDQRCRQFVIEGEPIASDCAARIVDIFFNGVGK